MAGKKSKTPTKISDLVPDDKNFNLGSEFGNSLIEKSFRKFGAGRSILIDRNNKIIAGNKSIQNAGAIGMEDVQVVESDGKRIIAVKRTDIDLDTPEGRELALADNASAKANIVFDAELVEATVGEAVCQEWGVELPENEVTEDNFDAEPPLKPITVLGDLYEIDNHKIICGDATDTTIWDKLNIDKGMCCFTSPPYNVGLNAKTRGHNASGTDSFYKGNADDLTDEKYIALLTDSLNNAMIYTGGIVFNIQQLAGNKTALHKWILDFKDSFVDIITWDKSRAAPVIAKGVLTSRFEWLIVFSSDKKSKRTIPLSSWRGTISNVYNGQPQTKNEFTEVHKASFPMHLPTFIVADLMNRCTGAVDCFMGTGTTLIACEQLGRKSYGIELSPNYTDLIIARYIKFKQSQSAETAISIRRNGKELSPKDIQKYLAQIEKKDEA